MSCESRGGTPKANEKSRGEWASWGDKKRDSTDENHEIMIPRFGHQFSVFKDYFSDEFCIVITLFQVANFVKVRAIDIYP